jgi:tetratricopeptide (TPR) repeat protein
VHTDVPYLFRHALMRDVAYELQPPGERAVLHRHALDLLRDMYEDPANPLAIQPWAEDILPHVRGARDADGSDATELRRIELELTYSAGCYAFDRFENKKALGLLGLVQEATDAPFRARIGAALRRGGIYHWLAQRSESTACREAALELAQQAGDKQLEAIALAHLATDLHGGDRADEVEGLYRRVLEIERGQNFPMQLAATLGNLAGVLNRQGRLDEAEQYYRESLEIFEAHGVTDLASTTTCNLGSLMIQQGRREEGEAMLERALQLARGCGARRSEGTTLGRMAEQALLHGKLDLAEELIQQALAIHEEINNRLNAAFDLVTRAKLREQQGRNPEAIEDYLTAAAIQHEAGWLDDARENKHAARALQG